MSSKFDDLDFFLAKIKQLEYRVFVTCEYLKKSCVPYSTEYWELCDKLASTETSLANFESHYEHITACYRPYFVQAQGSAHPNRVCATKATRSQEETRNVKTIDECITTPNRVNNQYKFGDYKERVFSHIDACVTHEAEDKCVLHIDDLEMICTEEIEVKFGPKCKKINDDKIEINHVDFIFPIDTSVSQGTSNVYIMSLLCPKIVLMALNVRMRMFYWDVSLGLLFIMLRYFKTRGRVFFKGE